MTRARAEFPDDYQTFQRQHSSDPTSAQAVRRNNVGVGKRTSTFEDLVASEMRKGCTEEIAGQRVLQQYGSHALRSRVDFSKGESIVTRFMTRVDEVMVRDWCDRTSAMETVRKEEPVLFSALELV